MATGIKNSGNVLVINSDSEAAAAFTTTKDDAGLVALGTESHDGNTGPSRIVYKMVAGPNGHIRFGLDNILWRDYFNHAIAPNDAYQIGVTTMTVGVAGGYLVLNSGNSLAVNAIARVQTYRTFELFALGTLLVNCRVRWVFPPISGNVCEIGLGFASAATTPTDGVYFKITAGGGTLNGVVNYGGIERIVELLTIPSAGIVYQLQIRIDEDVAYFFVNGVIEGSIERSAKAASLTLSRSMPLLFRTYNQTATPVAQRLEIGEVAINLADVPFYRIPGLASTSQCLHSSNSSRGVAVGQTANYTNSTEPVAATLSNTAAGYASLGGQWSFAARVGAATDFALFALQVPAPTAVLTNRNLWIAGVSIDTVSTGATGGLTPTVLQWALGVGSTAVSLATADGTGTRATRRIPLGTQSIPDSAAIGYQARRIEVKFAEPIMVESSTFVHIILRVPVGLATATQVIRGIVRIDGYYE